MKKQNALPVPKKNHEALRKESFSSIENEVLREAHKWVIEKMLSNEHISSEDIWIVLNRINLTKRNSDIPTYYITGLSNFLRTNYKYRILLVFREKSPSLITKKMIIKHYYGLFLC